MCRVSVYVGGLESVCSLCVREHASGRLRSPDARDEASTRVPKRSPTCLREKSVSARRAAALIMNLLTSLVKHDVLKTTWFKARAIQPIANQLVELVCTRPVDHS